MTQGSMIDRIYRSLLLSKYFPKGWGSPTDIKRVLEFRKVVSNREECIKLVPEQYPIEVIKDHISRGVRLIEGKFRTPFDLYMPELLPKEVKDCHFQAIFPVKWPNDTYKPICIQMAATGDQFFWRRRYLVAKPLLEEHGIGSIIIENPFYGSRKPAHQTRSILNNVLDIFTMGGCLIMEGMVLHNWCKKNGFGPVGFTGYSMGGHMATLAATSIPDPVVLVPCLSWSTASGVFTEGVMSKAIDWDLLVSQYKENRTFESEMKSMVKSLSEDAFHAGKSWMSNFDEVRFFERNSIQAKSNGINHIKAIQENKETKTELITAQKPSSEALSKWISDYKTLSSLMKDANGSDSGLKNNYEKRFALLKRLNSIISSNGNVDWEQHEAYHFMKGIMDECTHIANFSPPVDTSLVISVCAKDDAYVPRNGVADIRDIWPGAEVRYVEGGHVWAFVLHQKAFRTAIIDAFARYQQKYT